MKDRVCSIVGYELGLRKKKLKTGFEIALKINSLMELIFKELKKGPIEACKE